MSDIKIGTITDLEGNLRALNKILKIFLNNNIDLLVLAGDIPSQKKNSLLKILKLSLKLKIYIFIIPGSHESFDDYDKPIKELNNKLIIDGAKRSKVSFRNYEFIFLPGSDYLASNGQYILTNNIKNHAKKREKNAQYWAHQKFKVFQVSKIKKLIKNPKKTIIISHIPPRFNSKQAIDVAEFGKVMKEFQIKKEHLKLKIFGKLLSKESIGHKFSKDMILTLKSAKLLVKYNYPVKILKKNVGNKEIKNLIQKKNIVKLICGHIHESGNKACNLKGKIVKSNNMSEELFFNSGQAEKGYAGLVILKNNMAKYIKIRS